MIRKLLKFLAIFLLVMVVLAAAFGGYLWYSVQENSLESDRSARAAMEATDKEVLLPAQPQGIPHNLDECSQTLQQMERSLDEITADRIDILLGSTNKLCLGSVEFSEWVNELIYSVVQKNPDLFIRSFSNQSSEIQKNVIMELESPVHDGIDLAKSFHAIARAKEHRGKDRILSAISVAGGKADLKL